MAWSGDVRVARRTQSSLAVSYDGEAFLLVNASPDLHQQIVATPVLHPRFGLRHSPIRSVIVTNAEKVRTTGMKSEQKQYHHYTGYPGGLRTEDYRKRLARRPEKIIEDAVRRMLPKNKLAAHMLSKLNVYRGDKHPHEAQTPVALDIASRSF